MLQKHAVRAETRIAQQSCGGSFLVSDILGNGVGECCANA